MINKRPLGSCELMVSEIGLGTMNFGHDVEPQLAKQLLSIAVERGVNLLDTAETYPYPPTANTYGHSENIIGRWLNDVRCRDQLVLVSKIAGPSSHLPFVRDGQSKFNRQNITAWLEQTLRRLRTDYLDIGLLHWPERATNTLGQLDYKPARKETSPPAALRDLEETLIALNDSVTAGKIRYLGLSNETPWGIMSFLRLAERLGLAKIAVVQNRYHLLDRSFDIALTEIVEREALGFMAYSPLAFGLLSSKFSPQSGAQENSRLERTKKLHPYLSKASIAAAEQYHRLAADFGIDIAHMAIAYLLSRRYVSSVLVGASSSEQLTHNLSATDHQLNKQLLTAIDKIHRLRPNPCL